MTSTLFKRNILENTGNIMHQIYIEYIHTNTCTYEYNKSTYLILNDWHRVTDSVTMYISYCFAFQLYNVMEMMEYSFLVTPVTKSKKSGGELNCAQSSLLASRRWLDCFQSIMSPVETNFRRWKSSSKVFIYIYIYIYVSRQDKNLGYFIYLLQYCRLPYETI